MHCKNCGGNRVAWVGPLTALTHTECADCGAKNCQVEEGGNPSVGTGPKQGRFASLPVVATPPTDAEIQESLSDGGDRALRQVEALHKVTPCVPNADEIQCADVIVRGKDHCPNGKNVVTRPLTRDEVAFLIAAYTHAEVDGKMIPAKEIRDILVRVRTSWEDFEAGAESSKAEEKTETASRLVWWIARLAIRQMGGTTKAKVGDEVVEVTHLFGLAHHRIGLLTAVGELVKIEEDPKHGNIYTIKGLDGQEVRWANAEVVTIDRAPTKTPDLDKKEV